MGAEGVDIHLRQPSDLTSMNLEDYSENTRSQHYLTLNLNPTCKQILTQALNPSLNPSEKGQGRIKLT